MPKNNTIFQPQAKNYYKILVYPHDITNKCTKMKTMDSFFISY